MFGALLTFQAYYKARYIRWQSNEVVTHMTTEQSGTG